MQVATAERSAAERFRRDEPCSGPRPTARPRLRFTLRSLLIGMACFGAMLAIYRAGYWHGSADGSRNNGDLTQQLQALQNWWIVEHPGVPCPQHGPPPELLPALPAP